MSNLMTMDQLLGNLRNAKTNMQAHRVRSGGVPYLRLDKGHGEWGYGADQDPVEDDDVWAVDPRSLSVGYSAWREIQLGNKKVKREFVTEIMWSIFQPPVRSEDFPEIPDDADWAEQRSMHLTGAAGPNKGTAVKYSNGSQGGMQRFDELADEVITRASEGRADIVPLVRLGSDSYQHKSYGRIYKPIFEVVEWVTLDKGPEDVEPPEETEPPEEVEPPAKTEPRRRRRRQQA